MHLGMRAVLGLAAGIIMAGAAWAADADTPDFSSQLTEMNQIAAKDQAADPSNLKLQEVSVRINNVRSMIAREDYGNAINFASRLSDYDPSDAMAKALEKLTTSLQNLRDGQEKEIVTKLKKVLDDATDAVKTKTDPKDFDAVLSEVSDAATLSRRGNSSPERMSMYEQLQAASRFLRLWQSYLIEKAAGNPQGAANDLRSLSMEETSFMPIPRSELLERSMKETGQAANPATLNAKIEIHSFDDIPAALGQIEALQRTGGYSQEMGNLNSALQNLRSAYLAYQEKNYGAAMQQLSNNPFFGAVSMGMNAAGGAPAAGEQDEVWKDLARLKNQLLVEVAQALLALPDLPEPQPDERAADYLLRVAAAREKADDWPGLQQVLQVYQQTVPFNQVPWLQEDLAGLHAYLVGEKLESAGQNLDAIRSYRQALATIGKFFPADPPAGKLNELQKKYPDLYQQALQQPIAPRGM